jgi:glycosyltransferase involved in cell wall biosynthesis
MKRWSPVTRCSLSSDNSDSFTPTCTVVICTRNRPEHLERCLGAVTRLLYPRFDVLVVDNAPSHDRAREIAARWGADYVVEPALGLSRARNRGVRASQSEIIAFLDDDALPEPDWLCNLVTEFRDPMVMAVTGRILPLRVETEAERMCASVDGSNGCAFGKHA